MINAKTHKPLSPLNGGNNYGAKEILQYVEFAKGGNTHNIGTTLMTLCKDM